MFHEPNSEPHTPPNEEGFSHPSTARKYLMPSIMPNKANSNRNWSRVGGVVAVRFESRLGARLPVMRAYSPTSALAKESADPNVRASRVPLEWYTEWLPPVAATATAVDLTGDLRPRAVSRRPVESLKKFLTGRHGQRDGRDGSTGCGTCEVPTVSFSGFNCGGGCRYSQYLSAHRDRYDANDAREGWRVLLSPIESPATAKHGINWVRSERTETEAVKEALLTAEMNDPLNGRDGRVSTGRRGRKPCRSRVVDLWRKWLTERARHPFYGCRRTVPTVTGGSPTAWVVLQYAQSRFTQLTSPQFFFGR
ncbi:hypothetical protein C8J57DRAFT_1226249 [Mycena rebaudengoi]|nr:hypothetical protein C8J57DRAFT_1226249 [Mycena rebaudengoi]